ncbi:pyridoxamine 5'-phosphate oxidase family protein [Paenibacillus camerounensis]|uniref:pyridoxamine 5'-phosphate oxidase family protein n=1 Tax=Paenibacillus camerounensis TaxID=1243663 RepID=UPI0005A76B9E|nr:pyridoxamine 5'-phosphate oxidase family protein [Paenibacillus camerounensis]
MEQVSYRQRDCQDQEQIDAFLDTARVGIIGIGGDIYPYAVPVNYVWHEGAIYFHGMGSGKKVRLLEAHPAVSFTVFREDRTVTDPVPCKADTAYFSVMLFGEVVRVNDLRQATGALQKLLDKYTPGVYPQGMSERMVERYRSAKDGNTVAVYRIHPVHLTAKVNKGD